MQARRVPVRALAVAALLACALLWRLPPAENQWRFTICENDSLYQLHRIEDCLTHYPHVESVDASSHYPRGYRVPWMPLHTVFYASVAKLAGIASTQRDALVALLGWIPPLIGLLALLLVLSVARCFTADPLCLFGIGALCAVSADVCRPFFFGTIDHHLFAHLGVLLMVWGRLHRRLSAWIAGSLALLAMTPESIIYVTAVVGCFCAAELAALLTLQPTQPRSWLWLLSPAAVALAVWLCDRLLETAPLPASDLTWMYPTLFQPLWFGVLGVSTAAALRIVARSHGRGAIVALGGIALACAAFLLLSGGLQAIAARLVGDGHRLFVAEEASVFHRGFWAAAGRYRVLAFAALYVVVKLVAAARSRHDSTYWFQWLVLLMAFGLGFAEYRHVYVLASLQLIGLGLAAFETAARLRRLPVFAGWAGAVPAALVALAIVPSFAADAIADRDPKTGSVCDGLPLLEELATWLRLETPDPHGEGVPAYGVFATWSVGHHLHILGERAVVVDPFNYELDRWEEKALDRVWHAPSADAMVDGLRAYGARYLVLTNPAPVILDTIEDTGLRREDLEERTTGGQVTFEPAMSQFASFRLFMSGGYTSEFGQLQPRYFTTEAEHYTMHADGAEHPLVIPRGQIYELKPGAVIRGSLPPGAGSLTVRYPLRLGAEEPVEIVIPLATDSDGGFRFHTASPAPTREKTFAITDAYAFRAGDRSAVVRVTQEMVDSGAEVALEWQ